VQGWEKNGQQGSAKEKRRVFADIIPPSHSQASRFLNPLALFSLLRLSTRQGRFVNWLQTACVWSAHPRQTVFCALRFEAVGPRIALDLESTSYLPKNRSVRSPNLRLSSLNLQLSVSSASLFFTVPIHPIPSFESPFATAVVSVPPTVVHLPGTERELVESPSRLCPTADPTAPRHWGSGWLEESTRHPISFSTCLPTSLQTSPFTSRYGTYSTVLRTRTCNCTQSFQTHPPPCRPGLSTSTSVPEGPNYHPPLQLPKQLEASPHSPGRLLFRFCHYPIPSYYCIVPIHGHRLYVVPAFLFALILIMCASTTIHI
jgi:hypothetical protein